MYLFYTSLFSGDDVQYFRYKTSTILHGSQHVIGPEAHGRDITFNRER